MRAHNEQVGFPATVEFGEPFAVGPQLLTIECEQRVLSPQHSWHPRAAVNRAEIVEGVTAVQDPAVARVYRNRSVAAGMARHGHQHDTGVDGIKRLGGGESSPGLPVGPVFDKFWTVRPLSAPISQLFTHRPGVYRAKCFSGADVNARVREVGNSANVV